MKTILYVLMLLLFVPAASQAHPWPMLADLSISRCGTWCNEAWYYSSGTIIFNDAPEDAPRSSAETVVIPWGIHCDQGAAGAVFAYCRWNQKDGQHTPYPVGKCETKNSSTWELTPDSTCGVNPAFNLAHSGAYPGAECVVFGLEQKTLISDSISTPWGVLTAAQVANNPSAHCVKAQPPNIACEVLLPDGGVIDHGTVSPTSSSTRAISGMLKCGAKPSVRIIGGGIHLGPGVDTTLSIDDVSPTGFTLTSALRTLNAAPGPHQGVAILEVAPN